MQKVNVAISRGFVNMGVVVLLVSSVITYVLVQSSHLQYNVNPVDKGGLYFVAPATVSSKYDSSGQQDDVNAIDTQISNLQEAENVERNNTPDIPLPDARMKTRFFDSTTRGFDFNNSVIQFMSQPRKSVIDKNIYRGVPVRNQTFNILVLRPHDTTLKYQSDRPFDLCPYSNCEYLTTGQSSDIAKADAIVVHTLNISKDMFPVHRKRRQIWIAFQREPPGKGNARRNFKNFNGLFNATNFFERSSDISSAYGCIDVSQRKIDIGKINVTRPKLVGWIVSHCKTDSLREDYAAELAKYIPIDIYGKCGTPCPENENCLKMISMTYKFYLAFENSLCIDYITEKLWIPLTTNIVPIVLGAANYDEFLPPKSYIDIRDFSSPLQLAKYLYMLDRNDDLYREYFEWKTQYRSVYHIWQHCQWCAYLNRVGVDTTHIVHRLDKFDDKEHNCVTPKTYYSRHATFIGAANTS